jgi:cytochrome b561
MRRRVVVAAVGALQPASRATRASCVDSIRSVTMLRNTEQSWGSPAKFLHWTVAALVLAQIPLGWAAVSWPLSPAKLDLFVWHKSLGLLILLLMVVRAVWRLTGIAPALPAGTPPLERLAAHLSHGFLYLLMFLMPLTGWIVNSAANVPFRMFWRIPVPAITAPDKAVADVAARIHLGLFVALALMLAVHVGAALRHHLLKRNNVLARMLPDRGSGE